MIKQALCLTLILLAGCQYFISREAGPGKAINFDDLPGWHQDQHAQAFLALRESCPHLDNNPAWHSICQAANSFSEIDDSKAKQFFESYFTAHPLLDKKGRNKGLLTGYYEPLLHGSMNADARYRYPLYSSPEDMLTVELGKLYPSLQGKRVRGMIVGNKVVPYFNRNEIDGDSKPLKGQEILWVDDRDQLFFLHIQGSGRIQLPNGNVVGVGYANQNGQAYISIGKRLIQMGELKRKNVTLFSIKAWLKDNPDRAETLLNENHSYVFFSLRDSIDNGPKGSLNVPLTPERSLAIDPKYVELGSPIWLNSTYPDVEHKALQKLVIAQDTGGAIKGQLRADLFWGTGERAEIMAGNMKQSGEMYILLPIK